VNDYVLIIMAIGLFVLLALLGALIVLLVSVVKKLDGVFVGIVPFGQSGMGKLTRNAVAQGKTYFDQPTDPAIIQLTDVLKSVGFVSQVLKAMNIQLSYDQVAIWGRAIFDALDGLTDGEPAPDPKS
jgi:hypothetical protein